tara:strand:- start:72 stop:689 length:618 start_codon:yes stop_codon:yes gene_type:complete
MESGSSKYHHGNLKQVLLKEALSLIEERGSYEFTMRELARRAQVTHGAPYRHFADKNTLLAAIAEEGFTVLHTRLLTRQKKEGTDAIRHLRTLAEEVVEFAVERPFHYQLMFGNFWQDSKHKYPALQEAAVGVFKILVGILDACQNQGSVRKDYSAIELAVGSWSLAHGLSSLTIAGQLARDSKMAVKTSNQLADMLLEGILLRD